MAAAASDAEASGDGGPASESDQDAPPDVEVEAASLHEALRSLCELLARPAREPGAPADGRPVKTGYLWAAGSKKRTFRRSLFELCGDGRLLRYSKRSAETGRRSVREEFVVGYAFANVAMVDACAADDALRCEQRRQQARRDERRGAQLAAQGNPAAPARAPRAAEPHAAGFLAQLEAEAALTFVVHGRGRAFTLRCDSAVACEAWVFAVDATLRAIDAAAFEAKAAAAKVHAGLLTQCAARQWVSRRACLSELELDGSVDARPLRDVKEGPLRVTRTRRGEAVGCYAVLRADCELAVGAGASARADPAAVVALRDSTFDPDEDVMLGLGECSVLVTTPLRRLRLHFVHRIAMDAWLGAMLEALDAADRGAAALKLPRRGRGAASLRACLDRLDDLAPRIFDVSFHEMMADSHFKESFAASLEDEGRRVLDCLGLVYKAAEGAAESRALRLSLAPRSDGELPRALGDAAAWATRIDEGDDDARRAVVELRHACETWLAMCFVAFRQTPAFQQHARRILRFVPLSVSSSVDDAAKLAAGARDADDARAPAPASHAPAPSYASLLEPSWADGSDDGWHPIEAPAPAPQGAACSPEGATSTALRTALPWTEEPSSFADSPRPAAAADDGVPSARAPLPPAAPRGSAALPLGRRLVTYTRLRAPLPAWAPHGAVAKLKALSDNTPKKGVRVGREVWVYLREGKNTIGRGADCDVVLDTDPRVSRLHATLDVGGHAHAREYCGKFDFDAAAPATSMRRCADCRCFVCDAAAAECDSWEDHCVATARSVGWQQKRALRQAFRGARPRARYHGSAAFCDLGSARGSSAHASARRASTRTTPPPRQFASRVLRRRRVDAGAWPRRAAGRRHDQAGRHAAHVSRRVGNPGCK
ncbi:hypothetical protein M885DRAFT_546481 [Pelagophyceae sp. CCMP2097]|nr:hypothetical protein M885DRAFT_546481 [Pelagophyceae sp. CCMP2097]